MTTTNLTGRNYRITFLTERLVRLEYQSEGRFEDRPTTAVQCRNFPPVEVQVQRLPAGWRWIPPSFIFLMMKSLFPRRGCAFRLRAGSALI